MFKSFPAPLLHSLYVPSAAASNSPIGSPHPPFPSPPPAGSASSAPTTTLLHPPAQPHPPDPPLPPCRERIIRTHNQPWYIRLPSRIPISLLIWLLAMAFPFYGAINSLMASIAVPFTAFALPCAVFIWIYRTKEAREAAPKPPPSILKVLIKTMNSPTSQCTSYL